MITTRKRHNVGELRPSQLLYTYGIGSIVDLPYISAMVMGLDDWDIAHTGIIGEERLLQAVRAILGSQVKSLKSPPQAPEPTNPFESEAYVGVPVAAFPRWMLCPRCRTLAPIDSGLFQLKENPYRPDQTRYVHSNCSRSQRPPAVVPARFLVACRNGHLDDFPWHEFVHRGKECKARLKLRELGVTGEAADIQVLCETCTEQRRMSDATGKEGMQNLPACRGFHPHLRRVDAELCSEFLRTIALGASNSWFPLVFSTLSVPNAVDKLAQLVDEHWHTLGKVTNVQGIELLRNVGMLGQFVAYSDEEIWDKVDARNTALSEDEEIVPTNLKVPEWKVLSNPASAPPARDFKVTIAPVPAGYEPLLKQVILVERLREVRALIGFTRIESPGDFAEMDEILEVHRAPLSRRDPTWVPAAEVRGEGIFIEFREDAMMNWIDNRERQRLDQTFREAHTLWRKARHIDHPEHGYPGLRYVLLHSFAHALMRQLTLECGYTSASIRERIYSLPPEHQDGPMAGILLYTAAPDSEGTLGGLVGQGVFEQLGRHIDNALEQMQSCSSDPLCAEHTTRQEQSLHEAACHACLFLPETSCERGNKYLDRSVLVPTVDRDKLAFFSDVLLSL